MQGKQLRKKRRKGRRKGPVQPTEPEFQRTARREEVVLNEQCKGTEENKI